MGEGLMGGPRIVGRLAAIMLAATCLTPVLSTVTASPASADGGRGGGNGGAGGTDMIGGGGAHPAVGWPR